MDRRAFLVCLDRIQAATVEYLELLNRREAPPRQKVQAARRLVASTLRTLAEALEQEDPRHVH